MMSADVKANIKQQESSIIYEGIGEVPTLFFFFMKKFYTQKKHKMQTSNLYLDILCT